MKKKGRNNFIILISCLVLVSGCELSGNSYTRLEVHPAVTWSLPDTVILNSPFNLSLRSTIDNSCVSNLKFNLIKNTDYQYVVWAYAVFENHGEECTPQEIIVDSTVNLSLDKVGKYYFYFKDDLTIRVDSIVIKP